VPKGRHAVRPSIRQRPRCLATHLRARRRQREAAASSWVPSQHRLPGRKGGEGIDQ